MDLSQALKGRDPFSLEAVEFLILSDGEQTAEGNFYHFQNLYYLCISKPERRDSKLKLYSLEHKKYIFLYYSTLTFFITHRQDVNPLISMYTFFFKETKVKAQKYLRDLKDNKDPETMKVKEAIRIFQDIFPKFEERVTRIRRWIVNVTLRRRVKARLLALRYLNQRLTSDLVGVIWEILGSPVVFRSFLNPKFLNEKGGLSLSA